jgi:hypothetical protein
MGEEALHFLYAFLAGRALPVQGHADGPVDEAVQDDLCPRSVVADSEIELPLRS